MNVPVSVTTKRVDDVPPCYGRDWSKDDAECAGGLDPSYTHPKTGSHSRDRCDFYVSCGARTTANRQQPPQPNLIPPQSLFRPPLVTPPANNQPQPTQPPPNVHTGSQTFHQWLQTQYKPGPQVKPGTPLTTMPPQTAPAPQPMMYPGGAAQPATTWQLNYALPPFLSTPEFQRPGETIWTVLGREALRAALKGLAHAVAYFFDTRAIRRPDTPDK